MNPPTEIFRKVEKNNSKLMFLFYPLTLNIICFVETNKIFLSFYLCIFESDTVESDCSMQENYEIFKDLIHTVGLLYQLTVCSRDIKINALKMTSHQSTGHFQSLLSPLPDPQSEINPINQLIKTFWSKGNCPSQVTAMLFPKIPLLQFSLNYTKGCPPVRGDNPRALASGLSYNVRTGAQTKYNYFIHVPPTLV